MKSLKQIAGSIKSSVNSAIDDARTVYIVVSTFEFEDEIKFRVVGAFFTEEQAEQEMREQLVWLHNRPNSSVVILDRKIGDSMHACEPIF